MGNNCAFGGCVSGMFGCALKAVNRGQVADRAASVLKHVLHDGLGDEVRAQKVDIEELLNVVSFHLQELSIETDTGVVHQAVDRAECFDRIIGERNRLVEFVEIGAKYSLRLPPSMDLISSCCTGQTRRPCDGCNAALRQRLGAQIRARSHAQCLCRPRLQELSCLAVSSRCS